MGLNSSSLPFAAAGAAYTFTVTAMIPAASRGDGCAIAVFQDASFGELTRAVVHVVPAPSDLPSVQTTASGAFSFSLATQPAPVVLSASYAGSDTLWPAAASVVIGSPPMLKVATSALSAGSVGTTYVQQLNVTGGRSPYLWDGGTMPPGLVFTQDGVLSGTPTAPGTFTVSVSVVDDSAPPQVADASLQLVVH